MNTYREYYRARVLRSNGYKVDTRKRQVDYVETSDSPPPKCHRALKYLSKKGWNLQLTIN